MTLPSFWPLLPDGGIYGPPGRALSLQGRPDAWSRVVSDMGPLPALSLCGVGVSVASVFAAELFSDSHVSLAFGAGPPGFPFSRLHFQPHRSGLRVTLRDYFLITGPVGDT